MSPGPCPCSTCTASQIAVHLVAVVAVLDAVRLVADLDGVGAPAHLDDRGSALACEKCSLNRAVSIVADVMTILRSGRFGRISCR